MVNILTVNPKGILRINKVATSTADGIAKALRKAIPPTVIGTWIVSDGAVELTLWGWLEMYSASIKSALFVFPAPHKKLTLFGDALITATRDGKPTDMTEDLWISACAEIEDEMPAVGDGDKIADDAVSEVDSVEDDEFEEDIDGDAEEGPVAEEEEEEDDEEEEEEGDAEDEEEEEEEDGDDECYDSDDGGGNKRRAPRRRAMAAPEYRRMEMGLRSRIKMPAPAGKRVPKWHTTLELEPE